MPFKTKLPLSKLCPLLGLAATVAFLLFIPFQPKAFRDQSPDQQSKLWQIGLHRTQPSPPELAIATFVTSQGTHDEYFNAAKLLAYQFLHDKSTRITNPNITFVVFCGNRLSEEKKEVLRKFGATVITFDDVELPEWIHVEHPPWAEQFTKLRAFERTEYKRILYLDADFLIQHPMDGIFDDPIIQHLVPPFLGRENEIKEDEGPLPETWLFAARTDMGPLGAYNHSVPALPGDYANAGFWLIAPDTKMFEYLMTVMKIENRFHTYFMEQDMLNYVFRRGGLMPWRELNWKWCSNFVNDKDIEFGVHALHGKFWEDTEDSRTAHKMFVSIMDKTVEFEKTL